MRQYTWETADEINLAMAQRLVLIRKRKAVSQQKLSKLSGVSFGSIKRFETTGNISLISLTKLALALDCGSEIKQLFLQVPYQNIQEVINENK